VAAGESLEERWKTVKAAMKELEKTEVRTQRALAALEAGSRRWDESIRRQLNEREVDDEAMEADAEPGLDEVLAGDNEHDNEFDEWDSLDAEARADTFNLDAEGRHGDKVNWACAGQY
jgi:hypothetical protein